MTSLRAVLSHNMREQRRRLGFTQAKLAEKVNTSTHYIGMIENGRKFPTPEMLERISAELEIDAPELFSIKTFPFPNNKVMKFQDQVINDITRIINYHVRELEQTYKNTDKESE